jgi:hypothetical protein
MVFRFAETRQALTCHRNSCLHRFDMVAQDAFNRLIDGTSCASAVEAKLVRQFLQPRYVSANVISDATFSDIAERLRSANGMSTAPVLRTVGQDKGLSWGDIALFCQGCCPINPLSRLLTVVVKPTSVVHSQKRVSEGNPFNEGLAFACRDTNAFLILLPDSFRLSPSFGVELTPLFSVRSQIFVLCASNWN